MIPHRHYLTALLITALSGSIADQASAQNHTFSWDQFDNPISNVTPGSSYQLNNVDNSGIDFNFAFSQELDSRTQSNFNVIVGATNTANDFPSNFTGNENVEGITGPRHPLYLIQKSQWGGDKLILTITMSQPTQLSNLVIGDIDRLVTSYNDLQNSFEDSVAITASLNGSQVGTTLTSSSSTITVSGNTAESTSGSLLTSADTNSQITVGTVGLIDTFVLTYQNADHKGGGLSNRHDGWSNSHWITLGSGAEFTAVPEPSSTSLLALGGLIALSRRKR